MQKSRKIAESVCVCKQLFEDNFQIWSVDSIDCIKMFEQFYSGWGKLNLNLRIQSTFSLWVNSKKNKTIVLLLLLFS